MRRGLARLVAGVSVIWLLAAALIPRDSALRPAYLVNAYGLFPALAATVLVGQATRSRVQRTFRLTLPDAALSGFLALAAISLALQSVAGAASPRDAADLWRAFVVPAAAFWAVRAARLREEDFDGWVAPLSALCAVELAVGLLAWFSPASLPAFWPGAVEETGGLRVVGTLTQPDLYSAVLVFAATLLARTGRTAASPAMRWAASAGFALAFVGVFLSFSRASWLGGALALALLVVACGRSVALPCLAIALAVVGLSHVPSREAKIPASESPLVAAAPASGDATPAREPYAVTRLKMSGTVADRIVLASAGLRMFLQKPLLGWGFGTYDRHARAFVTDVGPFVASEWDRRWAASHCTHVSVLAEMGLLGYVLFVAPAAALATATVRRRLRDPALTRLWAVAAFLAVVSVLVDLRYVTTALGVAGLVLGLIAVRVEDDRPDA